MCHALPICLQPAELDWHVCLSVSLSTYRQTFLKLLLLVQFALILTKLGTRDLSACTQKTVEHIFEILIFTIFGEFLKFYNWKQF